MNHPQPAQNIIIMDARRRVASPVTTRTSGDRSPLSNRANMVGADTNWEHKDSSEGQPSTHDSICDAAWISTSDIAKSPYQTPGRPVTPLRSIDIDLESESPLSRLETPFLYGYGTELAPILEQRSIATLRTMGSRSTSDLSSLMHDAPGVSSGSGSGKSSSGKTHSKSDNTTATAATTLTTHSHSRPLRRQNSFSFDDGDGNDAGTHAKPETAAADECCGPQLKQLSFSRPTIHVVDIHAYPRKPIYPPPQRPVTPPSLRRIARPHSEGDAYVASASGRVAYEAPGFRPPRSGHGNLSTHPFMSRHHAPPPPTTTTTTNTATITTGITTTPTSRSQLRGIRRDEGTSARAVPSGTRHRENSNRASLDGRHLVSPGPEIRRSGICNKCRHPRRERWSLGSTLVGHGPGMRRGEDWCGRCACRKIVRGLCCAE
ncbi:hypothetical protein GGR51DRAFT_161975 [Nemania sp. FL0031]|nr:hypothetical protein GGR51DRAFT_161975 [Nemania sp. FL0031]